MGARPWLASGYWLSIHREGSEAWWFGPYLLFNVAFDYHTVNCNSSFLFSHPVTFTFFLFSTPGSVTNQIIYPSLSLGLWCLSVSGLCYFLGRTAFSVRKTLGGTTSETLRVSIFQMDNDLDIPMGTNDYHLMLRTSLLGENISDNSPWDRWENWGPERRNELPKSQQSIHDPAHSRPSIIIWSLWETDKYCD